MKERDEIAALFKDRLEHHTEPVDPAVWTKVQSGLAGKTIGGAAAASKLGVIIKAIAVTSILVGSVIGVGYLLQNPEKGSSNNEGQNINNTPIGQENQTKMSDFEPAAIYRYGGVSCFFPHQKGLNMQLAESDHEQKDSCFSLSPRSFESAAR